MRTRDIIRNARKLGNDAGVDAAGCATDFGRMSSRESREAASRIIKGFEDCDPEVYNLFRFPDLSGEMADGPTPRSMAEDAGLEEDDPRYDDLIGTLCTAWEEASSLAFEAEIIRACRSELSGL